MGNKEAKGGRVTLKMNPRHADASGSLSTLINCVAIPLKLCKQKHDRLYSGLLILTLARLIKM